MTENLPAINYSDPKMVAVLRQTVAKDATDAEFEMFAQFCQSTRLNPFKREIWFIKVNGRVQMMTGINGFFSIANSHPQYDGLECDLEFDEKTGQPTKATARAHRKDRKFPAVGIALLRESKGGSPIWNTQPSVMLSKVAKARALREAFPQEMGGLYTEDEMPREYAAVVTEVVKTTTPVEVIQPEPTEIYSYRIPNATREQKLFFERRGFAFNPDLDCWQGHKHLGANSEKYRVKEEGTITDAELAEKAEKAEKAFNDMNKEAA